MWGVVNYYPHHIGDYLRDTAHLTALEDGLYRRMLDVYYASEKPLPLNFDYLCRLVRANDEPSRLAVEVLIREFFEVKEDGIHNKRADEEIRRARRRIKAAKDNGKRGGRPKTQQVPTGNPLGSQKKALQKPNPKEKQDESPPNGGSTVWDFGKSLLTEQGLSTQSAGALIGSWLREWAEPEVADALRSAAGKADVRSYVAAILKSKQKKSAAPVGGGVAMP